MLLWLNEWPDWVPKQWRPSRAASDLAWVVVLVLSIYIGAEKFGLIEAWSEGACDGIVFQERDFVSPYPPNLVIVDTERDGRALASTVGGNSSTGNVANTNSAQHASSHGGHNHQHEALLFLFNAFVLGTIITHLTTFPAFASLQQTVVLFVLGVGYSFLHEGLKLSEELGLLGRSYNMWMEIDPHLILFTMLPALLTGDAMTLDTGVARRVAKQCIYLASVGVVINGFLTALFLWWYLPYDWSFLLCLTTGAILCATDPVAVVALLKELGASPTLTVMIQGESLLNDGTAIVLYTISYNMLKGDTYDFAEIVSFIVKKAMCAWGLGMVIGAAFLFWIALANNKLGHHNAVIQVTLTLCCAYFSFIIAEGVFHISGVLAVVASALVLAHAMWPRIVDKESMHTVWHMLEYLGNTIIFFLAGALTGKVMVHIPFADYLHLLVIYGVAMVIRAGMLFFSRPLLKKLSEDNEEVTIAEIIVMTWGGLRGAIGLTLAIQVTVDRAEGKISEMDANRVLFYVGGVAALTLCINAVTCPYVVNCLDVTQLPETKRRLLFTLRRRLLEVCQDPSHPAEVKEELREMLQEMQAAIESEKQRVIARASRVTRSTQAARTTTLTGLSVPEPSPLRASLSETTLSPSPCLGDSPKRFSSGPSALSGRGSLDVPDVIAAHHPHHDAHPHHDGHLRVIRSNSNMSSSNLDAPVRFRSQHSDTPKRNTSTQSMRFSGMGVVQKVASLRLLHFSAVKSKNVKEHSEIIAELHEVKREFEMIPIDNLVSLNLLGVTDDSTFTYVQHKAELEGIVRNEEIEPSMMRAINEAFLSIVKSMYWHFMEEGDLNPGSFEADVLLSSVTMAMSNGQTDDLVDWRYVFPCIQLDIDGHQASLPPAPKATQRISDRAVQSMAFVQKHLTLRSEEVPVAVSNTVHRWKAEESKKVLLEKDDTTWAWRLVESISFNIAITIAILLNAAFIFIEEEYRNSSNDDDAIWLVQDIFFNVVFIIELVLKLAALKHRYFLSYWNLFDFALVVMGWFSIILDAATSGERGDNADGLAVFRVTRVFRVMRLIRLMRLLRLLQTLKDKFSSDEVSIEIRYHLQKMNILVIFLRAQLQAQCNLLKYFGSSSQAISVEVARCLLQSQIAVYKALHLAVQEEQCLDDNVLAEVRQVRQSKLMAEELETFILDAHHAGVISAAEAHHIIDPLHEHMKMQFKQIANRSSINSLGKKSALKKNSVQKDRLSVESMGTSDSVRPPQSPKGDEVHAFTEAGSLNSQVQNVSKGSAGADKLVVHEIDPPGVIACSSNENLTVPPGAIARGKAGERVDGAEAAHEGSQKELN